jgi:hypothetical protein
MILAGRYAWLVAGGELPSRSSKACRHISREAALQAARNALRQRYNTFSLAEECSNKG